MTIHYHATAQGNIPFTEQEEIEWQAEQEQAAIDKAEKDAEDSLEALKLTGVEILGVMCSATKNDQNGLTAIAMGITLARMAASTFPDTVFYFENGNSLTVTGANFDAVYAAWTPFRQSCFAA